MAEYKLNDEVKDKISHLFGNDMKNENIIARDVYMPFLWNNSSRFVASDDTKTFSHCYRCFQTKHWVCISITDVKEISHKEFLYEIMIGKKYESMGKNGHRVVAYWNC